MKIDRTSTTTRALRTTAVATAAVASVATLTWAPPAAATQDGFCVVRVGETEDPLSGLQPLDCYATLAEALAVSGPPADDPDLLSSGAGGDAGAGARSSSVQLASVTLAVHYAAFSGTGSALVMSGTGCSGSSANLPAGWEARVRSTYNYCPNVRFFEGYNKSGSNEGTGISGPHNLGSVGQSAHSVLYAT